MEHVLPFITHHWELCAALVVIVSLIVIVEQGILPGSVIAITPQAAVNLINHEDAVVLDVRNQDAYRNGHIIDSKNIVAAELLKNPQRIAKYKNKLLILLCATGQESASLAASLKKQGYLQVMSIKGGIAAWTMIELPLIKK